jgi:hypothetical protein
MALAQSNPLPFINQSAGVVAPIGVSQTDPKAQAKILNQYGKLPLSFEANHGQTDARVKFLSRTGSFALFLTGDEAVLALSEKKASADKSKIAVAANTLPSSMAAAKTGGVLRMKLRKANPAAKVTGVDELAGTSNYFIGNDPAKWRTNVPTYAKVKYEGIYSGIDLVYYGNQRQLEYDFIIAPGANPSRIQFDIRGAKRIRQDGNGELVFRVGEDEIRWHKPVVYQEKGGTRQEIAAHYAVTDTNRVGFEVAKYDASRPLYIDPLIYSTYLGGSNVDVGYGIAVDSSGNAYVTGYTNSTDFPFTSGAFQTACGSPSSCENAFVAKIGPTGSALVYSTYLGGSGGDYAQGIAVDSSGNAYVTGQTQSTNFPVTPGAFQTIFGGSSDAFVTKLNSTGSALVYSTYLGGSVWDDGRGIAVDSAGNAYVTGDTDSTNFPVTPSAFQTTCAGNCAAGYYDAFVSKLNPTGSALVYSTYLGGSNEDYGLGIAADSAGDAYVTGYTESTDFPITSGAFQTTCANPSYCMNAFVTEINPTGSALVYSTYLGGSGDGDGGASVAVDSARGNAYIAGWTHSTNFPVTPGAFQTICGNPSSCENAFVTKLNSTGSALVYSTYLGGSGFDGGSGITVDSSGNAYVTGQTQSTNFPVTPGAIQTVCNHGGNCANYADAFVSKINPTGSALVYSSYLGGSSYDYGLGIAVDSSGNAYLTGYTASKNFPVTPSVFQTTCNDGIKCAKYGDAFVAKLYIAAATTTMLSSSPNPSTYGQAVTFTAAVTSSAAAPPDGETVSFMKGGKVLGTGTLIGGSASFTTSMLKVGTTTIKAVYGGDSDFTGSTSKPVKQVVSKATTTTALVSSQNPSSVGQSVTFTASATPEFGGTVTGTVPFYDGTTLLKTVPLSGGAAKFTTATLTSGTHIITATYDGSTSFDGSSASLTQTVN